MSCLLGFHRYCLFFSRGKRLKNTFSNDDILKGSEILMRLA